MELHVRKWDSSQSWLFNLAKELDVPDEAQSWPADRLARRAEFEVASACDENDSDFGVYRYQVKATDADWELTQMGQTRIGRVLAQGTHVRRPL